MFTGNMVTEAIPARVFSLYKIVTSKKEIARNEVQSLMEPSEIYEGSSYFSSIIKAAIELKIVDIQDNIVVPLVPKEEMKNIEDFRLYAISKINSFEAEQFFKVTNCIVRSAKQWYMRAVGKNGRIITSKKAALLISNVIKKELGIALSAEELNAEEALKKTIKD